MARAKKTAKKQAKAKPANNVTCFVMMPFGGVFDLQWENIIPPAIIEANLIPERADDLFRSSEIVGDIWTFIQKAKVLLAVLTTKNANVFYELGLAHAIGKPVVLIANSMDDVPFDLRSYRVLIYDKDHPEWGKKLRQEITTAIIETLDNPVLSVPSAFRKIVKSQAPEQDQINARLEKLERKVFRQIELKQWEVLKSIARKEDALDEYEEYLLNFRKP